MCEQPCTVAPCCCISRQALLQIAKAKEVCGECPVSTQCLEYALETNQDSGIWGGLDEEQRRAIRRQNAARQRLLA